MKINKAFYLSAVVALALTGCSSTQQYYLPNITNLEPITNADHLPTRTSDLSEKDLQRWSHLDILRDTVPGMSVDRAYEELIKGKKGKKVIVGVIDSGVEIDHEDLKAAIWTNPKEKAGNKIDDDKNGYIDDIHGWNFLGKANEENLELTRIVKRGDDGSETYKRAKKELEEKKAKLTSGRVQADMLYNSFDAVSKYLKKEDITKEDVDNIPADAPAEILQAKNIMYVVLANNLTREKLEEYKEYYDGQEKYNLNVNFDGRSIVGDNPADINDTNYGNNDVLGDRKHAKHGTHVAGIIAQTRHNGLGGDGVASDVVEIMAVRAVPDGDEYDKDVALAIRYAVDNGAKVINGSFGKYYQENSQWVRDAIKYAGDKDVLIVVAAGNDSKDLNPASGDVERYPNDVDPKTGKEVSDNFLVVGALNPEFGEGMVASFSNFGSKDVDVFGPGVEIYATVPFGKYDFLQGTSMASPNVAGVAALIRSYYPNLKAGQVKQILKDSGVAVNKEVIVAGKKTDKRDFSAISTSGKFVNAYNALIMADKISRGKK